MAALLFWFSACFVLYVYAGYPLLMWVLQLPLRSSPPQEQIAPRVSLLVAAYNEASVIAA